MSPRACPEAAAWRQVAGRLRCLLRAATPQRLGLLALLRGWRPPSAVAARRFNLDEPASAGQTRDIKGGAGSFSNVEAPRATCSPPLTENSTLEHSVPAEPARLSSNVEDSPGARGTGHGNTADYEEDRRPSLVGAGSSSNVCGPMWADLPEIVGE